jgi:phosphatidylglycerophosphatase GEP4
MHLLHAGEEADQLEACLDMPVLRHSEKKPGGSPDSLEKHFG